MPNIMHDRQNSAVPTNQVRSRMPSNASDVQPDISGYGNLTNSQFEMLQIQKNHGNRAVLRMIAAGIREHSSINRVRRFEGPEHNLLGEKGSEKVVLGPLRAVTDLNIGTDTEPQMLTYGEMVGIAGDWFSSVDEMRQLAGSQDGRDQIRWALWKDMKTPGSASPEPVISSTAKQAVMDRYFKLASDNVSHFSAGGTAGSTYRENHKIACRKAYDAGVQGSSAMFTEALTIEAFGNHFLTDMFSAGHVRTPRKDIKQWYKDHFPHAIDNFITYMAEHMHDYLAAKHQVINLTGKFKQAKMEAKIRTLGGAAIQAFSLGDIVSLAAHNFDNSHGLNVISDVNAQGLEGSTPWNAMGDNNLSRSPDTQSMAVAAIQSSLEDLNKMLKAGKEDKASAGGGPTIDEFAARMTTLTPSPIAGRPNVSFAAERFIPREDNSKGNAQLLWEWGKMNPDMVKAVDDAIKKDVAEALADKAAEMNGTDTESELTKEALNDLAAHFRSDGILAIQRALGNVLAAGTPAANSNP